MTDLPTRLAQALEKHECASAYCDYESLQLIHRAMVKCVRVLENYPDLAAPKVARELALASLEAAIKESGK